MHEDTPADRTGGSSARHLFGMSESDTGISTATQTAHTAMRVLTSALGSIPRPSPDLSRRRAHDPLWLAAGQCAADELFSKGWQIGQLRLHDVLDDPLDVCDLDTPCQPDLHGRYPGFLDGGAGLTAQPDIDLLHRVDKCVKVMGGRRRLYRPGIGPPKWLP